jgi:hypothetical protein
MTVTLSSRLGGSSLGQDITPMLLQGCMRLFHLSRQLSDLKVKLLKLCVPILAH